MFVKYLLAKAGKRIYMLERNTRVIEMYIAKTKSEARRPGSSKPGYELTQDKSEFGLVVCNFVVSFSVYVV